MCRLLCLLLIYFELYLRAKQNLILCLFQANSAYLKMQKFLYLKIIKKKNTIKKITCKFKIEKIKKYICIWKMNL